MVGNCPTATLSAPESGFSFVHHPAMQKKCSVFSKYCSLGPEIVFLVLVLRESPTVGGHRNTGSWEGEQPNTDQPTDPIQTSSETPISGCVQFPFQFLIDINIITFHCQTGKGCVCQLLTKARGPINQVGLLGCRPKQGGEQTAAIPDMG